MRKLFTLMGGVIILCSATGATAAPLVQKPVAELLGLRTATAGSTAFASGTVNAPAAKAPMGRMAAALAEEAGVTINASVVYPNNAQGMWSYNTTEWNPTRLSVDPEILATGGGIEVNGMYYINRYREMMGFEEITTLNYFTSDWSKYDEYTGKIEYVATTMAYDPLRDEAYGCFINPERNGYNFVRWNYDRFLPAATICALERPWSGCAFSSDGTLYAIERNGDLYKVNIKTGEMTLVGSTGLESTYLGDATIDRATDTMYWSVTTDTEFGLYSVDLTTAAATKVYDLINEEQLCGMYIPVAAEEPAQGAPAKISSVSTSFSGTSLSGKISFYSPRLTVGNTTLPAEENLTYTVKANGKEIATGECLPNKRVDVSVEMPETDNYYFTVTTSNADGTSPVNGTHKFVGPDSPKAPSSFQTTISGNTISLQWSSPSSTGVNGGNVNYSAATYTVVRYPDMKVIVEDATDRKTTDELPSPETRTDYYYVLSTTVEGLKAPDVKSTVIALGPITPPFTGEFTNSVSLAGWTIVDVNDDNTKWVYSSYDKAIQLYASKGFDDWAITPAVKVKAGTAYPFTIDVKTSNYAEETFEVKWGTEPTPEAMTNTLIEATTLKTTTPTRLAAELAAEETGTIYIGIHGMTEGKSNTLSVLGFAIESGVMAKAPAAPADFKAESPVDGTREVKVTFTAPATDISGDPLEGESALTKIEILRDGNVIATLTENIAAGAPVEYTDSSEDLTLGTHLYSAVAYNKYGDGTVAEAEVLVGARKPVAPASALFVEEGNSGKVTISWDAVTTDVNGNTIKSDAVTYRVIDRQMNTIADKLTETSFTYTAVPEGEQAFCQFGVYAVTAGGESDKMAATAYKPVGAAYTTPWSESFSNRSISSIFGYNYIQGNEPWQFTNLHDWGITPQDDDNGFAYFECWGGDITALVTGKIDLEGLNNPSLTYYTYNYSSSSAVYSNAIEIQADNGDGRGFMPVQSNVVAETGPTNTWNKVIVPLTDYEGQSVIFRIMPKNPALAIYTIDNLRVSSYVEYNLTTTRITAPAVADIDKPFEISVAVTNTGENTVRGYTVELWNGEDLVDFKECERIEPNQTVSTTFEPTLDITAGEYAEFHATVICSDDQIENDNQTETVSVGVIAPIVPAADGLAGECNEEGVTLRWNAPDLTLAAPAAVTETFENAESWSNVVEGWKFVDMDKTPVGGIQTPGFPCTGLQSWFVVDCLWTGFGENNERWTGHSGNKYIASEYVERGGSSVQSDDWAISPRLYGGPQALTFYAKSFDPQYLETFEVLASANTTATEDFKAVGTVTDVPNAWTQYRFKLPEGTRYAAIRSRSTNKFFLFIDDITFVPAEGAPAQLTLKGYNIYRNGVKINSTPVADTEFTDVTAVDGREYTYFVTAVYDNGESRPSDTFNILMSGIGAVSSHNGVSITASAGEVIVKGLDEGFVTVAAADGRIVAREEAAPTVRVSLVPGVYVVTAGSKVAKVAVR